MRLKSLTYTSLARLDLTEQDLTEIHRSARDSNALDGISGLLVFNGTHFAQVIEGSEAAIDDLVERLRRDPRHSGLEVRDSRQIEARCFPDWTMELVRVTSDAFEAKESIASRLPSGLPPEVTDRLLKMTDQISGTVRL